MIHGEETIYCSLEGKYSTNEEFPLHLSSHSTPSFDHDYIYKVMSI